MQNTIYTIGHSTRELKDFIEILKSFGIELLVDVRSYPGSKRYPHFNRENMADSLKQEAILYRHMPELGGRRKPQPDSVNTAWKNESFRGYADYMQTPAFNAALEYLKELAEQSTTAFMCSEAVWWRCHRSLISDRLKLDGYQVLHIMDKDKATPHAFTSPARVSGGKLFYDNGQLEVDSFH